MGAKRRNQRERSAADSAEIAGLAQVVLEFLDIRQNQADAVLRTDVEYGILAWNVGVLPM